ncbi:MAG: glycosyltransferase [Chthoniobacterales bacterium]
MKKNIVMIIDGLPGGGAERIVLTLASTLSKAGHEVTVISLRDVLDYSIPNGVHYLLVEDHYRGPLRRLSEIRRRARTLDATLLKVFAEKKIDLVVSHLPKTDRIVAASSYLRDAWFCLHCALTAGELDNKRGLRRFLKKRQLIKTYSGKKLITVSQALQQDVLAVGIRPKKMVTIYNPILLENVRRESTLPCPFEGERFLLHVGRFNKQKRHNRLLEAFKMSNYEGKLILLGQGNEAERATIEQQAKELGILDRIIFEGFVTNPYPYMRTAEALLLSSDYEGLPNVLVEALACGTQVVSTNCPYGPKEILCGDLARGLCELTSRSLADGINKILTSPARITEEFLAPFTLENSINGYLSLIDSK